MRKSGWMLPVLMLAGILFGCSSAETMLEITYPPETSAASVTVLTVSASYIATETEAEPEMQVPAKEPEGDFADTEPIEETYVLNTNSKKFHAPSCSSVPTIKEKNRSDYTGERVALVEQGYAPCKRCNP